MSEQELSQEDIDSLFESEGKDDKKDENINPHVKEFANLLNSSIEDVLKAAFSLEIVSKFVDLSIKSKDELPTENGVYVEIEIGIGENKAKCRAFVKQEFASILSDLMLMGPGEAKEKLEPDDLDAIKELFSQVLGNLQTSFKEKEQKELTSSVVDVAETPSDMDQDSFYKMEFDIAIPNVKNDTVDIFAEVSAFDTVFSDNSIDEEETEEEIPFKNVEETEDIVQTSQAPPTPSSKTDNLDLIMDVDLDVKVRIGEKNMLIKDILKLKEGSIVELEKNIEEPMDILINNKVVASGVVVVVGGRFGVKITSIKTKEERIKSLGG